MVPPITAHLDPYFLRSGFPFQAKIPSDFALTFLPKPTLSTLILCPTMEPAPPTNRHPLYLSRLSNLK